VTLPPAIATVPPWVPWVTAVMVSVSPASGALLSLARTLIEVGPESSTTVALSGFAVGLSFTGVTVTVTVAVAVPPLPSLTV
jgi:hypothetical protein